jgi:hypothetical protein
MKREIELRMWSRLSKKWFYNPSDVYECLRYSKYPETANLYQDKVWQEYTGKLDIFDRKIYDGDLVEFVFAAQTDTNNGGGKFGPPDSFGVYEVFYKEDCAAYYLRCHRKNWYDSTFILDEDVEKLPRDKEISYIRITERPLANYSICNVIGNIFENEYLIK